MFAVLAWVLVEALVTVVGSEGLEGSRAGWWEVGITMKKEVGFCIASFYRIALVLGKIKFYLKVLRAEVNNTVVLVLRFLVNINKNWQSLRDRLESWYHFR